MRKDDIKSILATDCGSTTTKAILIEKQGARFRLIARGEAPTTVEAPIEDVTIGVQNAIGEIEELTGRTFLQAGKLIKPQQDSSGVDIYLSTSSAGGGLQMLVAGVVKQMTAESAQRAALGAGAIVMDVMAANDNRLAYQKVERIRDLRPDMILLSGGVDGGTITHVVEMAEIIAAAEPKPRLGSSYKLPVIFAGNKDARDQIKRILSHKTALKITDNLRPLIDKENLVPTRMEIQALFLEHVMAHAPGYKNLMALTDADIMPTPAAVGLLMEKIAQERGIQIVGVDIGGATTDVFSYFHDTFNRSVSANYGMSYSIANVVADAGFARITRWLPFSISERDLRNRIKNKMIRPTTIPQTPEELLIEHAIAREALTLSFEQHKLMASGLKGVRQERSIADAFSQIMSGGSLINLTTLNLIIGSGGVLSHAPRRSQAALMLMDAFLPEGITQLAVDSIFMMPQLGVLTQISPLAAGSVFEHDCMIYLGTCIAPCGKLKEGKTALTGKLRLPQGPMLDFEVKSGEIKVLPLEPEAEALITLYPARGLEIGAGKGASMEAKVRGGVVGVILDCRGRQPFVLPEDAGRRRDKLQQWQQALNLVR